MKKIILTSLALSSLLLAAEPAVKLDLKKDDKLTASANLGFIQTSGNTETTTYSLDGNVKKGFDKHLFELSFDGQYASQTVDGVEEETKNKYLVELEYDYEFTSRFAFGYLVGFKQDQYSGYDYQAYTGPGAKYKLIEGKVHNLSLQGNILYARDRYDHGITTDSAINEYSSLRVQGVYDWAISENLSFNQELTYRTDLEDNDQYFVNSTSALKSKISDKMTAGLSYKVDYANEVAMGIEHTDKTLSLTVGLDY